MIESTLAKKYDIGYDNQNHFCLTSGRGKEIKDPIERNICYLDKLIDELAKERKMEKMLRRKCCT